MSNIKNLLWLLPLAFLFSLTACKNDEEEIDQRILLIGLWESVEIKMSFSIGQISLYQYYLDNMGYTEAAADSANQAYGDEFASGLVGYISFEKDNTFISTLGPSIETGTWWILNNTTLKLTEETRADQVDLTIFSLDTNRLVLGFDVTNIDDINGDGIEEEILIEIELVMSKVTQLDSN